MSKDLKHSVFREPLRLFSIPERKGFPVSKCMGVLTRPLKSPEHTRSDPETRYRLVFFSPTGKNPVQRVSVSVSGSFRPLLFPGSDLKSLVWSGTLRGFRVRSSGTLLSG